MLLCRACESVFFSVLHFHLSFFLSSPIRQAVTLFSSCQSQIITPPRANRIYPTNRAQGAATALEDAYILGHLFAETQQIDIPTLLHRYFTLRKPRADRLTAASANTLDFDHLVDGPAQVARDTALREMGDRAMKETREGSAEKAGDVEGLKLGDKEIAKQKGWGDCWFDASFQAWLFGFDLEPGVRRKVRNMEKSTNI